MLRSRTLFSFLALAALPVSSLVARPESPGAVSTPFADASVVVLCAGKGNAYGGVRIPSVITAKNGRLLVFAEGRASAADQANNAIIVSWSDDEGKTWRPARVVAHPGKACYNNPCPVFDPETGTVSVIFQKYPAGVFESGKRRPEATGPDSLKNFVVSSADNGETWTHPEDITASTKGAESSLMASGPHNGVRLMRGPHRGRLVIPFNEAKKFGEWVVFTVYSDDHGKTWKRGLAAENLRCVPNETAVAEGDDGSVIIDARTWKGGATRKFAVSHDGGETFGPCEGNSSLRCDGTQGALLRYSFSDDTRTASSLLVHAGPAGPGRRQNGGLSLSRDDGKTWGAPKVLIPGFFAYSGLVRLANGDIGFVYESTPHTELRFTRIPLAALTEVTLDGAK